MDEKFYERLDALIDVLNRIERRLGQIAGQSPTVPAPAPKDPSLRGTVRLWAEKQAIAVSASDIDALLDSVEWDVKRLRTELQRLSKQQSEQPARSLRRLLSLRS
jgi:hypothetical protein